MARQLIFENFIYDFLESYDALIFSLTKFDHMLKMVFDFSLDDSMNFVMKNCKFTLNSLF
jgi:hypothetical protein